MDQRSPKSEPTRALSPEVSDYLRLLREKKGLTQAKVAELGHDLGVPFDNSWISKLERFGPGPSFSKSLTYLRLIGADFLLLEEMLRADIDRPKQRLSPKAALEDAKACLTSGDGKRGLGVIVEALRAPQLETNDRAGLLLAASTLAKRADLLLVAEHFCTLAELEPTDSRNLSVKIRLQRATMDVLLGRVDKAVDELVELGPEASEADLRAVYMQILGFAKTKRGDWGEEFEIALQEQTGTDSDEIPRILTSLAKRRASRGDELGTFRFARAVDDVLERMADRALVHTTCEHALGQAFMTIGVFDQALERLRRAETLAIQLDIPLQLFEIRLTLAKLARETKNRALEKLMINRLRATRAQLPLTPRLISEFRLFDGDVDEER